MATSSCRMVLSVVLLSGLAAAASAANADPGFTVTPIAGSVTLLHGYDGNMLVSAGDDGIVLVDTCVAEVADQLLAAVKRISGKPIRFVVNTHVHGDHSGGNAAFQKLAPVIAHHNVRTRMTTGEEKFPAEALPIVTFDDEVTLHLNGENIRLLKVPAGHTDTDVVVFFEKAHVVHMGDVFMSPAASFVDVSNGGTILGLIEALEFVLPQIPADAKIVPGHGTVSSRADVARGLEVLKGMKAVVESAIREGKTLQQLIEEKPFEKWESSKVPGVPMHVYVRQFYRELTAKRE